jgi:hypothetical protein
MRRYRIIMCLFDDSRFDREIGIVSARNQSTALLHAILDPLLSHRFDALRWPWVIEAELIEDLRR